ncbi:MAG: hypothetical protein JXA54_17020 [Candidatus Heimdallarchaeota archaeon]|nr:hypothetical protein [Candidatus Heimdallarchaeota archaeon]
MVNLRTENIRCILCNKHLDVVSQTTKELFVCSGCQGTFCLDCLEAIKNYSLCPAAGLLGVEDHDLKLVKLLPPKPLPMKGQIVQQIDSQPKTVKILPKKNVRILDKKE